MEREFFSQKIMEFPMYESHDFFSTKIKTFLGDNKNPRFLYLTIIIDRAFFCGLVSFLMTFVGPPTTSGKNFGGGRGPLNPGNGGQ